MYDQFKENLQIFEQKNPHFLAKILVKYFGSALYVDGIALLVQSQ
jgi:hypothetical protein